MKNIAIVSMIAAGFLFSGPAMAAKWKFDDSHTSVGFSVRHMMISNVKGEFSGVSGTVDMDANKPTAGKLTVEIDVSTVDTRNKKRDDHLKSAEFFDAAKFPKAKFVSTKIVKAGKNYKVHGNLTLRGVTKPVVLTAEISKPVKSPWGQTVVGIQADGTINRQDFGVSWNKTLDAGGVVVSDEVKLSINAELVQG